MSKPTNNDPLMLISLAGIFILGAAGSIGWQIYTYLKFDEWHSISLITAMLWLEIKWASSPIGWIGLYKILDYIPLSLASLFTGFLFFVAAAAQAANPK